MASLNDCRVYETNGAGLRKAVEVLVEDLDPGSTRYEVLVGAPAAVLPRWPKYDLPNVFFDDASPEESVIGLVPSVDVGESGWIDYDPGDLRTERIREGSRLSPVWLNYSFPKIGRKVRSGRAVLKVPLEGALARGERRADVRRAPPRYHGAEREQQ